MKRGVEAGGTVRTAMIFTQELHFCPLCQDFVPYVDSVQGSSCGECGRPFTEADMRALLRHRHWGVAEREASSELWRSRVNGDWSPGGATP